MKPYLLATLFLACTSALGLPSAVQLDKNGFGGHDWSVTPDGAAFVMKTSSDASGFLYQGNTVQDIGPIGRPAAGAALTVHEQRVVLNPDGRYLVNFQGDKVVVRDANTMAMVWQGTLPNYPRPYGAQAVYFRAKDQRLQLLNGNRLLSFTLVAERPAQPKTHADVSFVQAGRSVYGNFVQTGAFSADGDGLFIGTMDGEVLQVDVGGETPQLRRRIKAFQPYRTTGFSDDADGYISKLHCVENCRRLVLGSYRDRQAAVVDMEAGRVTGRMVDAVRVQVAGIGDNWFVVSRGQGQEAITALTDADFTSPMPIPELQESWLAFGFKGGVAMLASTRTRSGANMSLTFTDVQGMVPELSRRRLEEADERARQQVAALNRLRAFSAQQDEFRRKLKTGDDSHCGLVVERKGDIALVETQIGQKWLKVKQLYGAGSRTCTFVNGALQD